jgi:Cu(I)/Ag(I) efflux system protein CusF
MNLFQATLIAGALGALAAPPLVAQAQMESAHDHGSAHSSTQAAKNGQVDLVEGEVRKIDSEHKKVTLQHGSSQGMPPMAMVYQVADLKMLANVKVGDKVRFKSMDGGGGKATLTEILPIR